MRRIRADGPLRAAGERSPSGRRVVERERPTLDALGSAQVARQVATKGAVLLKNDGALPLDPAALGSIVVIGPSARHHIVGGAGSSRVIGFKERETSQLDALRQLAGAGRRSLDSYRAST